MITVIILLDIIIMHIYRGHANIASIILGIIGVHIMGHSASIIGLNI